MKEISVKNIPDGSYRLNSLHIKEILTKYPDKVVSVVDRWVVNVHRRVGVLVRGGSS